MRKRVTSPVPQATESPDPEWLDLEQVAQVEVTSEDVAYPIEAALVPGEESGWRAAQPRRADHPPHLRPAAAPEPHVAALHRA